MAEEPRKPSATYGPQGPSVPVDAQPLCNEHSSSAYRPTYSEVTGAVRCNYPGCTMDAIASLYDKPYSRPYLWRSAKPTQPGWYVYEGAPGSYHVLCIEERLPGRFVVNGPQIWEQSLAYFDGLWKGPLDLETL